MSAPRDDQPPPRRAAALPSAFDAIEAIIGAGRRVAIFLDYDGTLTPIVETPDLAVLSEPMRHALRALAEVAPVAIVSGRDLGDLVERVAVPGLTYAGSHGFEVQHADGGRTVHAEGETYLEDLAAASAALAKRVSAIPGARVERKRFATAVHTRQVAAGRKPEVQAAVEAIAGEYGARLRLTGGKEVLELRPATAWDKGRVVEALAGQQHHEGGVLPVVLGDDVTDEDAFRALDGRGFGIIVGGSAATHAAFRLEDVDEVQRWLEALRGSLSA